MSKKEFLLVFLISLSAFAIRMINFKSIFVNGMVFFNTPDAYYHLRRIMLILHNFPKIPHFDSYMAYPDGAYCIWSPFFDFIVAFFAKIATLGYSSKQLVETVSALSPPVIGALTIFPFYLVGREIFNKKVAFLSSALLVFLPGNIWYNLAGNLDHDASNNFYILFAVLFLFYSLKKENRRNLFILLSGISLGFSLLNWQGNLFFVAIITIFGVLEVIRELTADKKNSIIFVFVGILLISMFTILPFSIYPLNNENTKFTYLSLSWFHLLFLLLCTLPFIYIYLFKKLRIGNLGRSSVYRYLLFFLILGGTFLIIWFIPREFIQNIIKGFGFIRRKDIWLSYISEFQPLFFWKGGFSKVFPEIAFSMFVYTSPLVLIVMFLEMRKTPKKTKPYLFFIIWTSVNGALTFSERRFTVFFAINIALLSGYFFYSVWKALESRRKKKLFHSMILVGLGFFIFKPIISPFTDDTFFSGIVSEHVFNSSLWLRQNTPSTTYYLQPSEKPEYGILVHWSDGHYIKYLGERPVTIDNFGNMNPSFNESSAFFLAEDEEQVSSYITSKRIRYLFLRPSIADLSMYCDIEKINRREYYAPIEGGIAFTKKYFSLIETRLYFGDGSFWLINNLELPAVQHFRLVFESDKTTQFVDESKAPVKIFEYVKGVKVVGNAPPFCEITASIELKTNTSREFKYISKIMADEEGKFCLTLPYSTVDYPPDITPQSRWVIESGKKRILLDIDEKQVQNCSEIYVQFLQ